MSNDLNPREGALYKPAGPNLAKTTLNAAAENVDGTKAVVDSLMLRRRQAFLDRLFPDGTTKAKLAGELQLIQTELGFRKRALEIVRETQLKALADICNQHLIDLRMGNAETTAALVQTAHTRLSTEMQTLFQDYAERMEKAWNEAQKLTVPLLRDAAIQQLENAVAGVQAMSQELIATFHRVTKDLVKA